MDNTGISEWLSGNRFCCREHSAGGMPGGGCFDLSAFSEAV